MGSSGYLIPISDGGAVIDVYIRKIQRGIGFIEDLETATTCWNKCALTLKNNLIIDIHVASFCVAN